MFDLRDPAGVMQEVHACRAAYPHHYIKVSAYDRTKGRQTTALSFIVQRPSRDPGFRLDRQETSDRKVRYTVHSYATDQPEGERFGE
jgi:ribulose-bisphosphate carboxylase small chain